MAELRFSLTSMSVGRLVKHKHGVLYLQDRRGEMHALTHWLTVCKAMTDKLGRQRQEQPQLGTNNPSDLLAFAQSALPFGNPQLSTPSELTFDPEAEKRTLNILLP